jgi:hypothetical protein
LPLRVSAIVGERRLCASCHRTVRRLYEDLLPLTYK